MSEWIVQYRHVASGQEWQPATPRKVLVWTEETAKSIAEQSNKVDREGFEWRAIPNPAPQRGSALRHGSGSAK